MATGSNVRVGSAARFLFALLNLLMAGEAALSASYPFPIGHWAGVMANSGVASLGSSSGVVLNPSLLGGIEFSSVSASANAHYILRAPNKSEGENIFSLNSVPNSATAIWKTKFGTVGLSILVPYSSNVDIEGSLRMAEPSPIFGTRAEFSATASRTRRLIGPTWGKQLFVCGTDCAFYVGSSLLVAYDTYQMNSFNMASTDMGGFLVTSKWSTSTTSLFPVIGVAWQRSHELTFGLRVDVTSILVAKSKQGSNISQATNLTSSPPAFQTERTDAGFQYPELETWGGALGVQWTPNPLWRFLADVAVSERTKGVDGPDGDRSIEASFGLRRSFADSWGIMYGNRFDMSEMFTTVKPGGTRAVEWLITAGVSWITKDLESTLGFFTIRPVVLEESKDPSVSALIDEKGVEIYGLILSGVYRF